MTKQFNEAREKLFPTLERFVPIVAKVHGSHHPEFHKVRTLFDTIVEKSKQAGAGSPDLGDEFVKLREITANYKVPDDVCESYEAVYKMLAQLDEAYSL